MAAAAPSQSRDDDGDLGELVSDAIAEAAKKLRLFLGDDYATYGSALLALDVVEAQLRVLPLDDASRRARGCGYGHGDDDTALRVARTEWMLRLDRATNDLEDVLTDMEAAAAAASAASYWPWRRSVSPARDAVVGWLRSDAKNKAMMELAVGRLAGVYVQGGEFFDDVHGGADEVDAACDGKSDGSMTGGESTAGTSPADPPSSPSLRREVLTMTSSSGSDEDFEQG